MKTLGYIERCYAFIILIIAPVTCMSTADVPDGPEQVVEAFYMDATDGRIEEALARVRPEDRPLVEALLLELNATDQDQSYVIAHIETEIRALEDEYAHVDVYIRWENGEELRLSHTLILCDGQWLLQADFLPDRDDEEPLPPSDGPPQPLRLVNRQQVNPYNLIHVPRPNPGVKNVPLHTCFFVIIGSDDVSDRVQADSVAITLLPDGGEAFPVLRPNQTFTNGYSGVLFPVDDNRYGRGLAAYVESDIPLTPNTQYQITVTAESARGASLPEEEQSWHFTTEAAPDAYSLAFSLDLAKGPDVQWHGEFFNSLAKPAFCTSSRSRLPHYDLIAEAQQDFPHAWNLQRDAYLAGFEHQPDPFKNFPNIVREQETRRITAVARTEDVVSLHVEDFFGHEQYGIPSNRPLSEDYHPGDEILIADGVHSARAFVVAAHDAVGVVNVTDFDDPADGWKIDYTRPLPETENPDAPGLFPPGGTYLRKFAPVGTPRYYWGRVNHEWDIVYGRYGRRAIPRFADAIGCLAIDGRSGTTAKDLAQHHEVTREITRHLIERYGAATLDWPWVILNEPDLTRVYWRSQDWMELQRFYDYTADAILRAFEDSGYDSDDVQVGGLELGAIWGDRHLRLDDFLIHCSPNVDSEDAVTLNAAHADPRLDGKRSARVERLCRANNGMGAPLDFLSVHTYNGSDVAAAKLIRSKELALEIDPEYYADLPVVSHETVPTWRRIHDPGAAGMYLGNGYFTSWMADFQGRLLQQGAKDERYAHGGDLILMHWPGIVRNFDVMNDTVREIQLADRSEVIPTPAFHFVNLLSTLRDDYWVFPLEQVGGHAVSGFAAMTKEDLRIVVHAHHHEDTASRSETAFEITLRLEGLNWERASVTEYRFDKEHNSYYRLARAHREASDSERNRIYSEEEFRVIQERAELRVTAVSEHVANDGGVVQFPVSLVGNGTNVIIVKSQDI